MKKPLTLNLDLVPPFLQEYAKESYGNADTMGLISKIESNNRMAFLLDNFTLLTQKGMYEEFLVESFISSRINNHDIPHNILTWLWERGDSEKFKALSHVFPTNKELIVFRGVAGKARARRIRGLSWTLNFEKAKWFAMRFSESLECPTVFKATIASDKILFYSNENEESEVVWIPRKNDKIKVAWKS